MAGLKRIRVAVALALSLLLIGPYAPTQSQSVSTITPPSAQFGANVGDDYFLATYTQLEAYWKKLAQESDRLRLVDIGRTEEGRTQWMAIVSSFMEAPGSWGEEDVCRGSGESTPGARADREGRRRA